jgi:hypothetical protein
MEACDFLFNLRVFWEGLSQEVLVGPVGCGKNRSSGFVVGCGALWLIFGFVGIVARLYWHLPGFAERIFVRKTWIDCGELCGGCGHRDGGRSR